jgi:hypothetical protein
MGGWILCVLTSQMDSLRNVCLLPQFNVSLITRYFLPGPTCSRTLGLAVQTLTVAAVFLRQYQGPRLIVSLILNGVQYMPRNPVRRRTSRYACMRMIRTSVLTSFSARFNQGAINRMFRVCRVPTAPLRRIFAVPIRLQWARALTIAE